MLIVQHTEYHNSNGWSFTLLSLIVGWVLSPISSSLSFKEFAIPVSLLTISTSIKIWKSGSSSSTSNNIFLQVVTISKKTITSPPLYRVFWKSSVLQSLTFEVASSFFKIFVHEFANIIDFFLLQHQQSCNSQFECYMTLSWKIYYPLLSSSPLDG